MAGGFLILTFAFPSLSLGLPTSTREGLTGVIPKVSDSVLPGQSPVTPCPQSPAGSCDSAARGSGGPPAPPNPAHTKGILLPRPAKGREGGGGESQEEACVSRTGGSPAEGVVQGLVAGTQRGKEFYVGSPWERLVPQASAGHPVYFSVTV